MKIYFAADRFRLVGKAGDIRQRLGQLTMRSPAGIKLYELLAEYRFHSAANAKHIRRLRRRIQKTAHPR